MKVDYNDVEKNWQQGDEKEELEHEFESIKRIEEKKKKEGPKLNINDPESIAKFVKKNPGAVGGGGGASMMFVELKATQSNGDKWNKRSMDNLASKWSAVSFDKLRFEIIDFVILLIFILSSFVRRH